MRILTSDDYEYELTKRDDGFVVVESTPEGLEVLLDTITLAGTATALVRGEERSSGVQVLYDEDRPSDRRVAVQPGTVAMWLSFEVLNYL